MFFTSRSRILIDDAVGNAVLDLIREAKEKVVLVSPYNRFWRHPSVKDAIHEAIQRDVRVTVVYRQEKVNDGRNKDLANWLLEEGGDVYEVEWLHAKIYLNESSLLVTSMNLLESSSKNSREVGIRIDDRREREELRDYVNKLIDRGRHVNPAKAGTVGERPALSGTSPPGRAGRRPASARSKAVKATGHCIRCAKDIPLNAEKPLCLTDYKQWEKREKRDYPEKHCHRCGKEYSTTFAKPLCLPCYRESPSATP